METVMTLDEIRSRYGAEWVLIEDPETDTSLEIMSGKVVLHSPDRDEFDRKALTLHPKRFAVLYTGELPDDMELVL